NGTHSPATEMVDVIQNPLTLAQGDQVLHHSNNIFFGQSSLGQINFDSEFLIDFVPPDPAKVVFFGIKKQSFQQSTSISDRWRIPRAQSAVNILQSFFLVVRRILLDR